MIEQPVPRLSVAEHVRSADDEQGWLALANRCFLHQPGAGGTDAEQRRNGDNQVATPARAECAAPPQQDAGRTVGEQRAKEGKWNRQTKGIITYRQTKGEN